MLSIYLWGRLWACLRGTWSSQECPRLWQRSCILFSNLLLWGSMFSRRWKGGCSPLCWCPWQTQDTCWAFSSCYAFSKENIQDRGTTVPLSIIIHRDTTFSCDMGVCKENHHANENATCWLCWWLFNFSVDLTRVSVIFTWKINW